MRAHIDEAVVEVQAQERGAHARLRRHGLLHHPLDGGERRGARLVVEVRVQELPAAGRRQESQCHGRDDTCRHDEPARQRSSHSLAQ